MVLENMRIYNKDPTAIIERIQLQHTLSSETEASVSEGMILKNTKVNTSPIKTSGNNDRLIFEQLEITVNNVG